MIGIYHEELSGIPSLVVADVKKENEALPVLTYFHGFTSAKEHNLPLAYLMAGKGYRVVLPDSKYHGERVQKISSSELQLSFWDIVIQNVTELQEIYNELNRKGLILNDRFGIAGTSMGGITTSAALAQYPWIKTAAVLMGSPKITTYAEELIKEVTKSGDISLTAGEVSELYEQLDSYDLSKHINTLQDRPLLFWHGENDPVVPFAHSHSFYEEAATRYHNKENIQFLREKNRDHKVSRYAIIKVVEWFEKHL